MNIPIEGMGSEFAEAAEAAVRGERVTVHKDGKPFVELVPAEARPAEEQEEAPEVKAFFERLEEVRRRLGIPTIENVWPPEFDDPAFSRAVLGLDDD